MKGMSALLGKPKERLKQLVILGSPDDAFSSQRR